jgi:hypothetical protein
VEHAARPCGRWSAAARVQDIDARVPGNEATGNEVSGNEVPGNELPCNEAGQGADEEQSRRAARVVAGMVRRWQADRDALNDLLGEASPYWDAPPFGAETDEDEPEDGLSNSASDDEDDTWNDGP